MDANKEINMARNELFAIREQKEEIIAEAGKRLSLIQADIDALEQKKEEILKEIVSVSDARQEAKVIVDRAKFDADQIMRAAIAEKAVLIDNARSEADSIIELANKIKDDAKAVKEDVDKTTELADMKLKEAENALRIAEKMRLDAEIVLNEANKVKDNAIIEKVKAHESLTLADVKTKSLEELSFSIDERIATMRSKEEALIIMEADLRTRADQLKRDQAVLESEKSAFDIAKKKEMEQIITLKDQLKVQSEDNAWRSRELDIGFELLKNKNETLNKDIKRLESLKKELSK